MYKSCMNSSRIAVCAALGMLVSGGSVTSVFAGGSLGGDCCADLEERVSELEVMTARKGNRRVSLKISGQINKAILGWDDGREEDIFVVDNSVSSSRFSFSGYARIRPGWYAGYVMELEIDSAESNAVHAGTTGSSADNNDDGSGTDSALDIRLAAWYLKSEMLGKLTVGQYSPATDNLILINLGRTGVVATADTRQWNSSFRMVGSTATWGAALSGIDPIDTARGDVVRYDTPSFFGFTVSASWGEDDVWDAALKWSGALGDFRAAFGVGYIDDRDDNTANWSAYLGSASILHAPTGLFLSGSYYDRDVDGVAEDGTAYYLQAGLRQRLFRTGFTKVYLEYGNNDDFAVETGAATSSSQVDMWGGGFVQNIDAAAMELYAGYRHYDGSIDSSDVEDFSAILTGARIKF